MKKKFLALALSLTMVLGLAACGGGSDNASSDGSSAASGDSGSSTVVVAMGSGFLPWIRAMSMRNIRP